MTKEEGSSIVTIRDASFKYFSGKKAALKKINLDIKAGEFVAIMGPTGAGKSTLCLLLNGSIPHLIKGTLVGDIQVSSLKTREHQIQELARKVGMVFQNPNLQLFCIDVESELAFGPENLAVDRDEIHRRVKEILHLLRLEGLEKRSPTALSGGQKQAVAIGAALTMNPEILVLDEPTSNLDPLGSQKVFEILRILKSQKNLTILMVSHKSEEIAEFADRVVIVDNGKIVLEGRPSDILGKEIIEEKVYIRPPQVSELIYKLRKKGYEFSKIPTTLEEAYILIKSYLEQHGIKSKSGPKLNLKQKKSTTNKRRDIEPIIKVRDLWHQYKGGVVALRNINLDIYPGEFVAIVGQNGSGKTTLVKHFNGLLKPTKGFVIVNGLDTRPMHVSELSKYVGYIYQNPDDQLFAESVEDEIAFGPRNLGWDEEEVRKSVEEVIKRLHLEHLRKDHPLSLGLGDRHRVAVASVLAMKPDVVILDEPTTGQDFRGSREIVDLINGLQKEGKTVIMITHDMFLVADYAERVIVLSKGQILLDGTPAEIFSRPDILEQTYLSPPQITKLAQKLGDFGFPNNIITIDEFCEIFEEIVRGGN